MNQEKIWLYVVNILSVNKKVIQGLLTTSSSFAFLTVTLFYKHPTLLYMKALLSEILHMTVATLLESTRLDTNRIYTKPKQREFRKLFLSQSAKELLMHS